ncbi:MAG: alpha/beta hydrolase [Brevundimonas sp.]
MPLNDAMLERLEGWKTAATALAPLLLGEELSETPEELRARYNRELARNRPPSGVSVSDVDMGGIGGALVTPDAPHDGRAMLYIHGGGYFSGGSAGYLGIAGHFAKRLGARVYIPDYRLAPEHPFPAPLDDVVQAYAWLVARAGSGKIVLAGDSAGGAMVVSTMVRARNAGLALPAGGVAISPWANLEMTGASYTTRDGVDPLCTREVLMLMARAALGHTRPNDPDVSPVFADVRGLPPTLIQIGESEVMLSDAIRLATHLADSRVRTSLEVWPDMFHVWPMFVDVIPEAAEALQTASAFLDRAMR